MVFLTIGADARRLKVKDLIREIVRCCHDDQALTDLLKRGRNRTER